VSERARFVRSHWCGVVSGVIERFHYLSITTAHTLLLTYHGT
jgi:hypothetical protein